MMPTYLIEVNGRNFMGGYPDLNRELTVPHTVALPIELYPPPYKKNSIHANFFHISCLTKKFKLKN